MRGHSSVVGEGAWMGTGEGLLRVWELKSPAGV